MLTDKNILLFFSNSLNEFNLNSRLLLSKTLSQSVQSKKEIINHQRYHQVNAKKSYCSISAALEDSYKVHLMLGIKKKTLSSLIKFL